MKYFVLILISISLLGCNDNTETNGSEEVDTELNLMDYFYPLNEDEPYIYAYFDEKAPLDERFHRMINFYEADSRTFVIERYNASLRISEGFTLDPNSLEILDHMMVDKNLKKRKSNITANQYFPLEMHKTVRFVSDYPSHLDSVTAVYDSRRTIIEKDIPVEVMDTTYQTILLRDTVNVHMVNRYTKESGTQTAVIDNYYAKGVGLVKFGDVDGKINYTLKSIISDSWWMKNAY